MLTTQLASLLRVRNYILFSIIVRMKGANREMDKEKERKIRNQVKLTARIYVSLVFDCLA